MVDRQKRKICIKKMDSLNVTNVDGAKSRHRCEKPSLIPSRHVRGNGETRVGGGCKLDLKLLYLLILLSWVQFPLHFRCFCCQNNFSSTFHQLFFSGKGSRTDSEVDSGFQTLVDSGFQINVDSVF